MSEDAVSTMSNAVIKILVDLRQKDFIEFKQYLQQEVLEGFPAIPKSQLEKAGEWFTKCTMKVTKRVSERMCQYELVEKLSKPASAGTKRAQKGRRGIQEPMK